MNFIIIKSYIYRYKGALAYILLAAMTVYSMQLAINGLNAQREARANDIVASLAQGAATGCISANQVTQGMHKVVVGSYNGGNASLAQFVREGTLTSAQAKRIRADSLKQTRQYLGDLPYRDCTKAADRYVAKITNLDQRRRVQQQIISLTHDAQKERMAQEPKLGN